MTDIIKMDEVFDTNETNLYIRPFTFIKGYAIAKNLEQTLIALATARKLHNGQYRKDGVPYIIHPIKVCSTLISYGIDDDEVLAAALLHDVLEDCVDKLPLGGKQLETEYGLHHEVVEIVRVLSKEHGLNQHDLSIYFNKIKANPKALLVKLSDRLHNSATLYNFSLEKMREYINETNNFLIPMADYGEAYYPKYTNSFRVLKDNIYSLNHSMEIMLNKFDEYIREEDSDE